MLPARCSHDFTGIVRVCLTLSLTLTLILFSEFGYQLADAVTLQCPPAYTLANDKTKSSSSSGASEWCCPNTHPALQSNNTFPNTNDTYTSSYANSTGVSYAALPACRKCGDSLTAPCAANGQYACCPYGRYCAPAPSYIEGPVACAEDEQRWGRIIDTLYYDPIALDGETRTAVPVIDVDLCRFRRASNGSRVVGSPCDPQFECEAYSQSQYQCVRCADPALGPPGDCSYFTCLAGGYCPHLNEVSSARFVRQQCPAGSFCGANSTAPTPCIADAGQYCPKQNMSQPASCNPPGTTSSTYCLTSIRLAACPPGSYCAVDSIAQPCAAGTFSSDFGVFACDSCPSKWYTSNSGSTECSQPSPMMIGLVCLFCLIFLACCACGWKILSLCCDSYQQERELKRRQDQKHQDELQRQKEEREKIAKEVFKREKARIKADVLERLLRDLRVDLELRYPQGLQPLPTIMPATMVPHDDLIDIHTMEGGVENNEVRVHIACEGASSAAVVPVRTQTPMQAYEQFVTDCITADFNAKAVNFALGILAAVGKPAHMTAIGLHRSLMGVRSMVLEFYQMFTAIQQEQIDKQQETEESPGGVDRQEISRNTIRQRLSSELNEHASAWINQQLNQGNRPGFRYTITREPMT